MFFFVISQHDLCFMLNRTIKKGLVYRLKSLRVLSFHVKLIWSKFVYMLIDGNHNNFFCLTQTFWFNISTHSCCFHSFLINYSFFHTFLFHINETVSRTQQLALTDWRDEQKDCVFIGLQNKLRRTIYAEFCKFSEAENRLGSREEMMRQSKLSIQTETSTTQEQSVLS